MFVGAVPKQVIEQIMRSVDFPGWGKVFVGCSGSSRFDQAVKAAHPKVEVHSNDVSLLTCSLGALLTDQPFPIEFTGRLAFIEPHVADRPFIARVAAVEIALEMSEYRGENEHAKSHFANYQRTFAPLLADTIRRVTAFRERTRITAFHAGDFRLQARRAADAGGGVAAFPPTYRRGYERLYKFLDDNTEWPRPSYEVWSPDLVEAWLDELDAMGVRYCVLTDRELERHTPVTVYRGRVNKPVFTFSDRARSSVRASGGTSTPFKYTALDPVSVTAASKVTILAATSGQMNYLKDVYLAHGILHTDGIANFLVLVDGRLAGGFIYALNRMGSVPNSIYLLSDFALAPRSRVSKLVAMLATSRTMIHLLETKLMARIEIVLTTAFTDHPVSMKYRGIFTLQNRKPGMLNYASAVRDLTPAAIFAEWFRRFADNRGATGAPRQPGPAGKERPVHERPPVLASGCEREG